VFDNHRNVLHNVMRYTNNLEIGARDRLSLIESCSYSGTVSSLFSALLNGAAVCPFDLQGQGIARLASWIGRERITIFHSTPTIFEQLLATDREFDGLRMIRLEGDRAELRQISLFQSRFGAECVLVNGLGLTEAGIVRQFFVTPQTKVDGDVVPIGQAVEDMAISLVDSEGDDVEQGSVGEITIRSKYLACGYWKRPDLTEAAFLPDPNGGDTRIYRTGDLGRMHADGCLDYIGRKDFRAKVRGVGGGSR
jgi:non-ribosomal peptide synthetase component F